MGGWESFGATVYGTGDVLQRSLDLDNVNPGVLVNITKDSDTGSNVLWESAFRDPSTYSGIVVSDHRAFVIEGNKREGRVYNMDGSEYTGPIYINNLVLK